MSDLPVVEFSSKELVNNNPDTETIETSIDLFRSNGFLILKNVLEPEFVRQLHEAYLENNKSKFVDAPLDEALDVGHKRKMISVELKPPFNDERLYANPFFYPVVNRLLAGNCILGSFGSVVSMPGSEMQHIHFDHDNLFFDHEIEGIADRIPVFALTVVIPLVDITEETGATRMWPGSHLEPRWKKQELIDRGNYIDPYANRGDCILFDYRTLHTGMPNKSDKVRPILYSVYYRPWFRDMVNYSKQKALIMGKEEFMKVPDKYSDLFTWALDDEWSITKQANFGSKQPRNSLCNCGSGIKYKHCHGQLD